MHKLEHFSGTHACGSACDEHHLLGGGVCDALAQHALADHAGAAEEYDLYTAATLGLRESRTIMPITIASVTMPATPRIRIMETEYLPTTGL